MQSLDSWVSWEPAGDGEAAAALARLAGDAPQFFADSSLVSARTAKLPFYADHRLLELQFERDHGQERAFVLHGPDATHWLDGTSAAVHEVNESEALALTDATVEDYVRFFFYFVRGESGPFVLIESGDDIIAGDDAVDSPEHNGKAAECAGVELEKRMATIRSRIRPLTVRGIDEDGHWVLDGSVAYLDALFLTTLAVAPNGLIEMTDDEPVESLEGVSAAEYLPLELEASESAQAESDDADGSEPTFLEKMEAAGLLDSRVELQVPDELPRDRDVTQAIVAVLLEDAVRAAETDVEGNRLLRHFNSETGSDKPLDWLSRLASSSFPVIIIESDIPFVEDFVAGLVVTGKKVDRSRAADGDELRCQVDLSSSVDLHLISFHAYRSLYDSERTAHELAIRDAAVFIGCYRFSDVPEPLKRIRDLVLTFPRIDRRRFARIFEGVFHVKPTPGWDAPGADWTRYLVPADFHMPRRLRLTPDDALQILRDRVEARLEDVTPDVGPRLSELHGLGEARQVCEDLIADIHAAQADRIPWSAVDRGLLLAGAPGTGKTTLARAVAKECGVKFIVASAASWQAAGHLGDHIRAMRDDFAEARRFAPAILFLDEIDGIGSRELLGGDVNATYQTDVINALLEQIQGINTADPVIVIAATNYPEKVDPALRRAGRLDQTVEIPLPNIQSLEKIFAYYLGPYRDAEEVARGVKTRGLAELSLGSTGADVELFVRGAARRARRANRKIKQEDLSAEVTRRPRNPTSAPRLGKEQIRYTAVHEAGHAVAQLTSSTHGEDITFVTIIPRLDGSLGFVASVPLEGREITRRTMLEKLETFLAGRAAEEIVFGDEAVGAGAGGYSTSSDLAVATRLSELYVCKTGLGESRSLHWTDSPSPAQVEQIDGMLTKAYGSVLERLEEHRPLLDRVAAILEDKQELSGAELRKLLVSAPAPMTAGLRSDEGG